MTEKNELQIHQPSGSAFSGLQAFEDAQRMAKALCSSSLVPENYRGPNGHANALIALEMAQRVGASPMAVMQNMHVIQGRPSWSSSFIIASLNSCGRFSQIRFEVLELGPKTVQVETWEGPKGNRRKVSKQIKIDDVSCRAWVTDSTGERLEGPKVTIEMAALEGWLTKNDSKWQTMPELMLRYRAAAFFGRLYAPDILMGMHSADEVEDMPARAVTEVAPPLAAEPGPLAPVEPETVEAEVVESPGGVQTVAAPTENRDAIKAELDTLGVEYSSKARTATLVQLLADAKTEKEATEIEPPPLAEAQDEPPAPTEENQQQNTGQQGTAPKDLF